MIEIRFKLHWNMLPPGSPIDNKPALVHVMAWHQTGNKRLPEPMMIQFTDTYMWHQGGDELTYGLGLFLRYPLATIRKVEWSGMHICIASKRRVVFRNVYVQPKGLMQYQDAVLPVKRFQSLIWDGHETILSFIMGISNTDIMPYSH